MKITSYKILFRLLSYLSDITNGGKFFVKYKLLLGTMIIGVSGISAGNEENTPIDTDLETEPLWEEATCYRSTREIIALDTIIELPEVIVEAENKMVPSSFIIACYMPIIQTTNLPPDHIEPPISPVGDISNFISWIQKNIVHNNIKGLENNNGQLIIHFTVDEKGNIVHPRILSSLSPEADAEVLRILSTSEKWQPAIKNGKAVPAQINIPVNVTK